MADVAIRVENLSKRYRIRSEKSLALGLNETFAKGLECLRATLGPVRVAA